MADSDSDSDSDEDGPDIMFDPTQLYKQILEYLKPGETVSKALCRLGMFESIRFYFKECVFISTIVRRQGKEKVDHCGKMEEEKGEKGSGG